MEEYKKCLSCGKYFLQSVSGNNLYCSKECNINYKKCTVCGNYVEYKASETLENEQQEEDFICSEACKTKYKLVNRHENTLIDFSEM